MHFPPPHPQTQENNATVVGSGKKRKRESPFVVTVTFRPKDSTLVIKEKWNEILPPEQNLPRTLPTKVVINGVTYERSENKQFG